MENSHLEKARLYYAEQNFELSKKFYDTFIDSNFDIDELDNLYEIKDEYLEVIIALKSLILNKKWFASWGYENSKKLAFLILACIARYVQKMPIFSA